MLTDIYTVTFRKEIDRFQKGHCKYMLHTAIVSVDATNATVAVGHNVKHNETTYHVKSLSDICHHCGG